MSPVYLPCCLQVLYKLLQNTPISHPKHRYCSNPVSSNSISSNYTAAGYVCHHSQQQNKFAHRSYCYSPQMR
jgi:hypothetical protein